MPIYANCPAIFRQRECENQFCQILRKAGHTLIEKSRNFWKLVDSLLQLKIKIGLVLDRGRDFCILHNFSVCICSLEVLLSTCGNAVVPWCLLYTSRAIFMFTNSPFPTEEKAFVYWSHSNSFNNFLWKNMPGS